MDRPVVVLAEPFSSASLIPAALREAGIAPVALIDPSVAGIGVLTAFRDDEYVAVVEHHGDDAATAERIRALGTVVGVVPGTDRIEGLCGRLGQILTPDRVNVPELAAARRNKYLSHQAVAAHGLDIIKQTYAADHAEIAAWIEREGLAGRDLVVKPATSAGTDGVGFALGGKGWQDLVDGLLGTVNRYGAVNDKVLVQEYITGMEYAIDTVSYDGRHSLTDITRYRKVQNANGWAIYDNVEWLPYDLDEYGHVLDYTFGCLDAVGFRYWAAHTEVMDTEHGMRLVEINPRPAGAMKPLCSEVATAGESSQVSRIVDICAGRGPGLPPGFTLHQRVMAVFLIAETSGVVRNAEIFDRARDLPSYNRPVFLVRTGDRVEATTDLVSSMTMGYILLAHDDVEQVYADREAIRALEKELVIEPD